MDIRNWYNSNQFCTYGFYDPVIRNTFIKGSWIDNVDLQDVIEFDDKEHIADELYKIEMLQLLNIDDIAKFDKDKMQDIHNLLLSDNVYNKDILNLVKKYIQIKQLDESVSIFALFSYDFFFFFHNYLSDIINTGYPHDSTYLQLKHVLRYHINADET